MGPSDYKTRMAWHCIAHHSVSVMGWLIEVGGFCSLQNPMKYYAAFQIISTEERGCKKRHHAEHYITRP